MNKLFPRKAKDIKGAVAIAELQRAHLIIVLLALSFAAIISFVLMYDIRLDMTLGTIAVLLLIVVAAVSLTTVFAIRNRK